MAQEHEPNIDHIKEVLVSSGVLKAAALSEGEHEKIKKELAAKGISPALATIICSRAHYCIIIKS
jgi:hypothetical protein